MSAEPFARPLAIWWGNMAPQDIRKKLTRVPFQPIRIHISDGTSFDIIENGQASMILTELTLAVDPDESGFPTRAIHFAPNHVTRIEPIPPIIPPEEDGRSNGEKSRNG